MPFFKDKVSNFNIDTYINPHLRRLPLNRIPAPISRFLGYRKQSQSAPPNLIVWFWAFIGAFVALLVIESLNRYAPGLKQWHPPVVVASFGAAAILQYNAIGGPLSQPRNLVLGQTFAAIVGVCVTKLFRLNSNFVNLEWVAGAVSCGTASAVMGLTGTIYPPAGATAVLAATNTIIIDQGWMFIPFVLLDSCLFLVIALLINNIQRQWPIWWWTPQELKVLGDSKARQPQDEEEQAESKKSDEKQKEKASSSSSLPPPPPSDNDGDKDRHRIVIGLEGLTIPAHIDATSSELAMLKSLQIRLIAASKSKETAEA